METDDVILFTAFPLTKYSNSLSPKRTNPRKRSVPTRDVTATPAGSRALPPLREPSEARRHRAHGARDRTRNSARELPLLQTGPRAARTRQTHSARSGSGSDRREARPRSAGPAARPEPGRCGRRRVGGGVVGAHRHRRLRANLQETRTHGDPAAPHPESRKFLVAYFKENVTAKVPLQ